MAAIPPDHMLLFGSFRLIPARRLLLDGDKPVRLGSRALEILIALVERPGQLLRKDDLIARVWLGTHVVEANLKFQIAGLRRALGDGRDGRRFIETSPGQGYRFVAEVTATESTARQGSRLRDQVGRNNLPTHLDRLVGRGELVAKLVSNLTRERLLSIVGPGGIGKTSVAITIAEQLIDTYEDGVWMVDLVQIRDPEQVRSAVAVALGVNIDLTDPLASIRLALRAKRMLIVLDNCAHVVDAVARLVSALLRSAPGIRILATSREPLRVEGEHVHRLAPLASPPRSALLDARGALQFPAVQLFVERAAESSDVFALRDEDAPVVGEICRRLDGIPLAIELAAARVGTLGIRGLLARLDDRLTLLAGRRTAVPRHQTLRATIDWSFDLLSPPEQVLFQRLGIFAGGFTLAAGAAVVGDAAYPVENIAPLVFDLVDKSLVIADAESEEPRFRLLDTTRIYARERLAAAGELDEVARRHAAYFLKIFEATSGTRAKSDEGHAAVELEMDNLRTALAWALAPAGDPTIGVCLAAAAQPTWLSASLLAEAQAWTETALRSLDEAGLRGSRQEMVLQAALGITLQLVRARTVEAYTALSRALALAEELRDADYQLHILHTLWIYHMRIGDVRTTLTLARQAQAIAAPMADPVALTTVESMLGIARHFAGEYQSARPCLERLMLDPPPACWPRQMRRAGYDQLIIARCILAQLLWVQGFSDQAAEVVRMSVEEARRLQHPVTLCSTLAWGPCALALRTGDLETGWRVATELVHCARKHALADLLSYGMAVLEIFSLQKTAPNAGVEQIRMLLQRWRASQWHVALSVGDFAEAAADAGFIGEISALVEEALQRAEGNQELWAYPEMLRIKGELLLRQDSPDPRRVREYFVRSLERARAQGALAWQLRSAVSLYRFDFGQGVARKSREVLSHIYAEFREGFDTPDLKAARRLLTERPERQEIG